MALLANCVFSFWLALLLDKIFCSCGLLTPLNRFFSRCFSLLAPTALNCLKSVLTTLIFHIFLTAFLLKNNFLFFAITFWMLNFDFFSPKPYTGHFLLCRPLLDWYIKLAFCKLEELTKLPVIQNEWEFWFEFFFTLRWGILLTLLSLLSLNNLKLRQLFYTIKI